MSSSLSSFQLGKNNFGTPFEISYALKNFAKLILLAPPKL